MKKFLTALCVCVVCLMLPLLAMAVSQSEWNQQCRLKTKSGTKYYEMKYDVADNGSYATVTDLLGTLDAGTYVKRVDTEGAMSQIGYLRNGSVSYVWVYTSDLVSAVAHVSIDDGTTWDVPEALLKDMSALYKYLSEQMPGYSFSAIPGSSLIHKEKSSNTGNSEWKQAKTDAEKAASRIDETGLPKALIYAPRSGQASLWPKASAKNALKKLPDGTVVYIVEKGRQYTQVLVDGLTGYIVNTALEMLDSDQLPIGEGELINTTGKNKKNVELHMEAKKGKFVLEWPVGTEVIVWSVTENKASRTNWYEVEYDGVRRFVEAQYLKITMRYDADDEDYNDYFDEDYNDYFDEGDDDDYEDVDRVEQAVGEYYND